MRPIIDSESSIQQIVCVTFCPSTNHPFADGLLSTPNCPAANRPSTVALTICFWVWYRFLPHLGWLDEEIHRGTILRKRAWSHYTHRRAENGLRACNRNQDRIHNDQGYNNRASARRQCSPCDTTPHSPGSLFHLLQIVVVIPYCFAEVDLHAIDLRIV